MAHAICVLLLSALTLGGATRAQSRAGLSVNPVRRVVMMLHTMQQKVVEEGERDEKLFERFMCYCKSGKLDLETAVRDAKTKIPQVESNLEEATASKEQLEKQLTQHKEDREEAKAAIVSSKALREKEAAAYANEASETKANLAAVDKAIAALEKGTSSFLQTSTAAVLRRLTVDTDMSNSDRDVLSSFLSLRGQSTGASTGEVVGILKQMKDTMVESLAEAATAEEKSAANFEAMVSAKKKEAEASTKAIEEKLSRSGEASIKIETFKEDLDDTKSSLYENEHFLGDLHMSCETKQAEWDEVKKSRMNEILALSDTIKILNDDDALDLFKKTLPSPSLLQTQVSARELRHRAAEVLQSKRPASRGGAVNMELLVLALRGRKVSFEKIIAMIDDMSALLKKQQTDDDDKKSYCQAALDKTEDRKKELDLAISDLGKAMDDVKSTQESLEEEIATLGTSVKDLDSRVAEATATRKIENAEYKRVQADDIAAKEVLQVAEKRLLAFYASMAPAPAPALVQVAAHSQSRARSSAPPPTIPTYSKKIEESNGVISMLRVLMNDLDKQLAEIEVEEKDSQKEYEQLIADSAAKRMTDAKSVEEKESTLADVKAQSQKMALEKKTRKKQAKEALRTERDLHLECDWLVNNYEARKEARAAEVDSLANAKAVLSGADDSL